MPSEDFSPEDEATLFDRVDEEELQALHEATEQAEQDLSARGTVGKDTLPEGQPGAKTMMRTEPVKDPALGVKTIPRTEAERGGGAAALRTMVRSDATPADPALGKKTSPDASPAPDDVLSPPARQRPNELLIWGLGIGGAIAFGVLLARLFA